MSPPPKSTIMAAWARWASLRMVFWVMAGSSGAKTGLSQTRARLVGAHWGATGFPGKAVAPQCAPTTTIPSGDRFDQQGHALGADAADLRTGRQLRAAAIPIGVGDLPPAPPLHDRAFQRHHPAAQRRRPPRPAERRGGTGGDRNG